MKTSELCVPLAALKLPGEAGEVAPGVGDEVDISATATVARIEGDKAWLTLATVNGEPVEAGARKPESLDDEESAMRADAEKSDAAIY
jgi:hypothetical protein